MNILEIIIEVIFLYLFFHPVHNIFFSWSIREKKCKYIYINDKKSKNINA